MAIGSGANRVIGGRYRLVARLGAGAMGTVWRAFDEMLQAEAALKEIEFAGGLPEAERAERVERAMREARHTAKLRGHPHVVTVLDVVLQDGLPWIVMELVPSVSLFQRVRDAGPLPDPEVARIGVAIADALAAAHAHHILHRDVKPSNVLIGTDGRVVLTDFGIATHDTDPTLTVTGLLGTPMYMPPERLNGAPATPEADLFGLGATLYFAAEGRPAFQRDSFGAMLAAIMLQPPEPPEHAGSALADVLLRLLEKDPARRPDTAEVRRLLTELAMPRPRPPVTPAAGVVRADGLGWRPRARTDPPTAKLDPATRLPDTGDPDPDVRDPDVRDPDVADPDVRDPDVADPAGPPAPPVALTSQEEDGAILVRWDPSPSPGVSYRVVRVTADAAAPGGRVRRGLGTTSGCELSDGGATPGTAIWHEVTAVGIDGRRSEPVSTPARTLAPAVAALRADMAGGSTAGDTVVLTWRPDPAHDEVVIERRFDPASPVRGAIRRFSAAGGRFTDTDVQPGAVYRYVVHVAGWDAAHDGGPRGAEAVVTVVPRPRAVHDLELQASGDGVTLRWTTVPPAVVRVYATGASTVAGLAGTSPFGPPDHEVATPSLDGRARLVGESRRGRLHDPAPDADTVYTPVSVVSDRAVIGPAVSYPTR